MHPTSMENMERALERYLDADFFHGRRRKVVDIGAQDINGSYRRLFAGKDVEYIGVDMAPGQGVDLVLDDPYKLPFADGSVDLVLSGQMLEHCEFFWLAFQEMVRVTAPDGYLLVIAPSAGPIHRYPVDCYRFYPDAFHALAKLAGCHVVALWRDERGPWCDLVGIFSKQPTAAGRAPRRPVYATQNKGPFADHPEADRAKGQEPYLETLARIHNLLQPRRYLEIGVRGGRSLELARCPAVAIEPDPAPRYKPPPTCQFYPLSSDDFFAEHAASVKENPPDLAFIDGMHLFENVLKDFMNIERNAHPGTVLVIDDIFPVHPAQATRIRKTKFWTGDVWKIAGCLAKHRPDLLLIKLDTSPCGLLLVVGLKPANTVLWDMYNPIVGWALKQENSPPAAVLARQGSLDPHHPALATLLSAVRSARDRPNVARLIVKAREEFRKATVAT